MVSFNCSCDTGTYGNETLLELRTSLMERLGYAGQADNPSTAMRRLLDNFLRRGQQYLYRKFKSLETERFFQWEMVVGERFYDIHDNLLDDCTKRVDKYQVTGVFLEDLNGAWLPLKAGIPPTFYTGAMFNGLPQRYEIRQCIEVFPAPDAAYNLWVKGRFGLLRFTQDTDVTTLDSELVFLWALANAKAHYGQPDARVCFEQAREYRQQLTGASHLTRRYIPGRVELPPAVQPILLEP